MVKYMYYNKREKYFVSEYFYKNKIGCVKVDVEMYNVYNAFARSCYNITILNEQKTYHCYNNGDYYIQEKQEFYYNEKLKILVSSDNIRTTILGDFYSVRAKNDIKPFTNVKYKNGKYYLKGHKRYKYDDNYDLVAKFYRKKYPKYLTIGQPKSHKQYYTYIYSASDFVKKTGDIQIIDKGNVIVICNDGKYYCTYDIGEFYPSVFWEVYRYENNS